MKNVKNNAKPTITWFGGIWLVASAVRTNDKIITILAKEVININILGAKDKTVSKSINFIDVERLAGSLSEKTGQIHSLLSRSFVFQSFNTLLRSF